MMQYHFTKLFYFGTESEMATGFSIKPAGGSLFWTVDTLKLYVFIKNEWQLASVEDDIYVLKTGDTMTGALGINYNNVSQSGSDALIINTLWNTESESPSNTHSGIFIYATHEGTEDQEISDINGLTGIFNTITNYGPGSVQITGIRIQSGEATDVNSTSITDIAIDEPGINDDVLTPYVGLWIKSNIGKAIITGTAKCELGGDVDIAGLLDVTTITVGDPAGGNMGSGTINVENGLYKNGNVYIDPDYVLEEWATGKIEKTINNKGAKDYKPLSIKELRQHIKNTFSLPTAHDKQRDLFETVQWTIEQLEIAYGHILDCDARIAQLEKFVFNELDKQDRII